MPALSVENLSFAWLEREEELFGPISFDFPEGKVTALLGANGTGKSTLLNVLAQRIPSTRGIVRFLDKPAVAKDFNYMLQHPDRLLFRHLSLLQNIRLTKKLGAIDETDEKEVSVFFPDQQPLDRYPWQCSVGQRQRAVLLRSFLDIESFPATLLDEPFASISRDSKIQIYKLVRARVESTGRALVFVTHDLSEACILADVAIVLSDGICRQFDVSAIHHENDFLSATNLRDELQRAMLARATVE